MTPGRGPAAARPSSLKLRLPKTCSSAVHSRYTTRQVTHMHTRTQTNRRAHGLAARVKGASPRAAGRVPEAALAVRCTELLQHQCEPQGSGRPRPPAGPAGLRQRRWSTGDALGPRSTESPQEMPLQKELAPLPSGCMPFRRELGRARCAVPRGCWLQATHAPLVANAQAADACSDPNQQPRVRGQVPARRGASH